jgi:hypothetical protein
MCLKIIIPNRIMYIYKTYVQFLKSLTSTGFRYASYIKYLLNSMKLHSAMYMVETLNSEHHSVIITKLILTTYTRHDIP